jgi:hypothetical protein
MFHPVTRWDGKRKVGAIVENNRSADLNLDLQEEMTVNAIDLKNIDALRVWDFIVPFTHALVDQLKKDERRWGDTWKQRLPEGQEVRSEMIMRNYFDQYNHAGQPIPWLKVAGLAMICWIRDNHPEIWNK